VDSVDTCPYAAALAKQNVERNGFEQGRHTFFQEDVFDFLKNHKLDSYDLIILDPPAFAKKRSDVDNACRGYKQLMRQVMQSAKKGALLLTCSCSYHIDETLFQTLAAQAATEAQRSARVIGTHIQAPDHPFFLSHPEGRYLKSLLLAL
jgi:23S rRNA (cytosine1962-C5)-methyltransferase